MGEREREQITKKEKEKKKSKGTRWQYYPSHKRSIKL